MNRGRVIAVGSVNVDTVVRVRAIPAPGETATATGIARSIGGKSFNQAAAAAAYGASVELVALTGEDAAGAQVRASARRFNIGAAHLASTAEAPTGQAFVTVDDRGENSIAVVPGTNALLTPTDEVLALVASADVVLLALEVPVATVIACARHASEHGTLVVLNPSPVRMLADDVLRSCDVVVVNRHELAVLSGETPDGEVAAEGADWESLAVRLQHRGLPACVVTLGAAGAVVLEHGQHTMVDPFPVTAVDTTGSGDAFAGTLAAVLAQGGHLTTAATEAAAVGAYAATGHGAAPSYPMREELEAWLAARRIRTPRDD